MKIVVMEQKEFYMCLSISLQIYNVDKIKFTHLCM